MGIAHAVENKSIYREGNKWSKVSAVSMQGAREEMEDTHVICTKFSFEASVIGTEKTNNKTSSNSNSSSTTTNDDVYIDSKSKKRKREDQPEEQPEDNNNFNTKKEAKFEQTILPCENENESNSHQTSIIESVDCKIKPNEEKNEKQKAFEDICVFAIFDGHAGATASKYCETEFLKHLKTIGHIPNDEELKQCFLKMDESFKKEKSNTSGTTAIIAIVEPIFDQKHTTEVVSDESKLEKKQQIIRFHYKFPRNRGNFIQN